MGAILGWGWLWTLVLWRAIAAYSIYKEVVSKKTTREAILYLIFQGGIYLLVATVFIRSSRLNITNAITMIMFMATGITHFFWGIKSLVVFQQKTAPIDRKPSQK